MGAQPGNIWSELLEVARWAPSPHNTQPWLLHPLDNQHAQLSMVRRRLLPDEDVTGSFLICAMGVFIEAMRIAAANRGLVLSYVNNDAIDLSTEQIPFASLSLQSGGAPDEFADSAIRDRKTSRLPPLEGDAALLPPEVDTALARIATSRGHALQFISDPATIRELLRCNADAAMHDLAEPAYSREVSGWYRYTRAQAAHTRDGLAATCMRIPAHEMWMTAHARWLLRVPILNRVLRAVLLKRVGPAARLLVFSGPFFDRHAAQNAGTMLLRFWLALHNSGGGMHPLGNLITNASACQRLKDLTGATAPWFVVRIGRTAPAPRSHRLHVEELLWRT